jgi:hypothetical protein
MRKRLGSIARRLPAERGAVEAKGYEVVSLLVMIKEQKIVGAGEYTAQ